MGLAVVLALVGSPAVGQPTGLHRRSVRPDNGLQGNGASSGPVCSNGGACVAFYTDATNLLPQGPAGDNNGYTDVYLYDGGLRRISETVDGQSANGPSMAQRFRPSIDDDCTCVAFSTDASNLVPNDTNNRTDVVLRTLTTPPTNELISVGLDGNSAAGASSYASVSGNCSRVAFRSTANNLVEGDENQVSDVFVHDRSTGLITRVSVPNGGGEANGPSTTPSISGDGRCVAFASLASNLVAGDTNGVYDIYVACDGEISCRASVSSEGVEANGISFHPALNQDGTVVAFKSEATNLVPNDLNRQPDIFVHDCISGTTERVSVSTGGQEADDIAIPPSITRDGRRIAFGSFASTLADDIPTNGRSQIYVRDLDEAKTFLISVNDMGVAQNGSSPDLPPSICPDGDFVAFASAATNLVPGDSNGVPDAFVGVVGTLPTPTPLATNTPIPVPCSSDTDCDPGTVCGDDGICVPEPTPTPTIPCQENEDCPEGFVCIDNVCRDPSTPTPTPTPLPTCMVDEDCECPEGTPVEDCDRCRAGVCVPPRPCEFGTADLDCRGERETCLDGFCECGGDCNLNGLVFGTEISTMMCILGGACEPDECVTGDVNEDGFVTGCDVTLAVLNLGLGCPGEGTPLIFGAQRTSETRTIAIGHVEAIPGQVVVVPLQLEGGGEVSSAHTDILINTAEVDVEVRVQGNGAILPDCELADGLVANFDPSAIRLPQVPRNPEGIRRVRVAAIDTILPFPLDTFGEGEWASCRFRVGAGVTPGTIIPLLGDPGRTDVGDFSAQPFTAVVADGSITVGEKITGCDEDPSICPEGTICRNDMCVPDTECESSDDCLDRQACVADEEMSGVARCECAVDCNRDGQVFANEILLAIGIFAGNLGLDVCPAADISGDSEVFANEVLIGIQNFANGCP
jgi:Tol biopolymer transport system component